MSGYKKAKITAADHHDSEDVIGQQSNQMNAVINEFKIQSQMNFVTESRDDFNTDDRLAQDGQNSQFNELSLLTRDPFFPSPLKLIEFPKKKSFLFGTGPPPIPKTDEKLLNIIRTIDFTRITNRLILGGLFWKNESSRRHRRNNILDGSIFLKKRFNDNYMIWNLGSKLEIVLNSSG